MPKSNETSALPESVLVRNTEAKLENQPLKKAILLSRYHDISAFCSQDETRYVLNGAHYDPDLKVLEGTDGRILIRVPVLESTDFPDVKGAVDEQPHDAIIPMAALKRGLQNIPKATNLEILQHARLDVNGKITLTTTDLDQEQAVTVKSVEGKYPNTTQIIPTEEPFYSISLQAGLIKKIGEYAAKHCAEDAKGIKFMFSKDNCGPVRFEITLEDKVTKATGVLMPMRMS